MMAYAVDLAYDSVEPNRHGCVVVRRGKVVGRGWNKSKTHPAATIYHSGHMHAELSAIVATNSDDLRGADLFVSRVYRDKSDTLGLSRPCEQCMSLIRNAGIRRIFFTTADGRIEQEKV
jgi:tRNA(Arg) A34 adenosine deaminase TadA